MIKLQNISDRLADLKFPKEVLLNYNEPHRFYHTTQHLIEVITNLSKDKACDDELFLAAVYHDAVYDPQVFDNEEKSAKLFLEEAKNTKLTQAQKDSIYQMIMDTITHTPSNDKSQALIKADLNILEQPLEKY